MKKYFVIIAALIFVACDKEMEYNYFIVNECDESINVYFEANLIVTKSIVIPPYDTILVHQAKALNGLNDRLVEHFFNKISIYKEDKISKVNYIDYELWDFQPTSKDHANSYLTVKPEDF